MQKRITLGLVGKLALAIVISLVAWLFLACAQDQPDKKGVDSAKKGEAGPAVANGQPLIKWLSAPEPESNDLNPIPFGTPLDALEVAGQSRKLFLSQGKSARDEETRAQNNTFVYYHDWLPAPRVNPAPLRGYPSIVWDATSVGGKVALTFRFGISSDMLRQTCAAFLRHKKEHEFQKFAKEPSKAPSINVQPLPVTKCWFGISDSKQQNQLLADAYPFCKQAGDFLDVDFHFSPELLTQFLDLYNRRRIVIQYAPLVRGNVVQRGNCTIKLDLQAINRIERELNNANLPAGSSFTGSDGATYVTQNGYDHIKHKVFATLQKQITIDGAAAAPFVVQDPALLGNCFEVTAIAIGELSKLPTFNEQALAEYLRPLLKKTIQGESKEHQFGTLKTHEKSEKGGAGFAAIIPPFIFGGSGELSSRDLKTIYNTTGVRYSKVGETNEYRPASIRVYKVTTATAEKNIAMSTHVVVGVGSITGHSQYMPMPQGWTEPALHKALEPIRAKYQGYPTARQADVLLKLQQLEKDVLLKLQNLEKQVPLHEKRIGQAEFDLKNNVDILVKDLHKRTVKFHSFELPAVLQGGTPPDSVHGPFGSAVAASWAVLIDANQVVWANEIWALPHQTNKVLLHVNPLPRAPGLKTRVRVYVAYFD